MRQPLRVRAALAILGPRRARRQEHARIWAAELRWMGLHYTGPDGDCGRESDFPRQPASWLITSAGALRARYITFEGGHLEETGGLWLAFGTEERGGVMHTSTPLPRFSRESAARYPFRLGGGVVHVPEVELVPPLLLAPR